MVVSTDCEVILSSSLTIKNPEKEKNVADTRQCRPDIEGRKSVGKDRVT